MLISHLVAAAENNVIGKDNQLPWHLPNDFKYFKNKSWGMPVIMGWNTFNSLKDALPGRFNIVVTSKQNQHIQGIIIAHSINEALDKARETDCKEVFIIGGGKIFKQSTGVINRIYLTRVLASLEGDVFYPAIDTSQWSLTSSDLHFADEKHAFNYTFETWQRNNSLS